MNLRRLSAALCVAVCGLVSADVAVPDLQSRVTDLTSTLSAEQTAALEHKLAAFEQAKGSQVAVLIVPTTQPEAIEQYGIRVAEKWKIGRKGVDDGAILIVAKDDHRLRIEVGYGLEGALNDAIAKRIISETITPAFKNGDFAGGIDAGVDQIIQVINGEPLPPPSASDNFQPLPSVPGWAIVVLLFVVGLGRVLRTKVGGVGTATLSFVLIAGLVLLVGWPLIIAIVLGIVVTLFVVLPMTVTGGFTSGGGRFGGSGGGGGFSGGGGSFGGGGASGSW